MTQADKANEGREETQLEQDAKEYLLKQGTHDRPDITGHDFKQGWQCGYNYLRDQLSKEAMMRKELADALTFSSKIIDSLNDEEKMNQKY